MKRTFGLIEFDTSVGREEISVLNGHRGTAAVPLPDCMKAICYIAEREGLMFDLCYTGKAMAGTLVLAKRKFQAGENIVFINTGGSAGVFTCSQLLGSPGQNNCCG